MKPLLSKATRPFLIYVLIILIISIPVYYFVVDTIWKNELDEHNRIVVDKTSYALNRLKLSDEQLDQSIALWNHIQPGTNIQNIKNGDHLKDSVFTILKQKSYSTDSNIDRFRCLSTIIHLRNRPFRFTVETNIEESQETIAAIAVTTVFFFILIVAGLLFLNRKLSASVWKPFQDTLGKLKTFNLNTQSHIQFDTTDTTEFEELNQSLNKLIEHSVSVYKTQKEFTENASHELQTPLAILKNKLDILLQDDDLTEKQYDIAEDMNKALTRSSRINKNLLLLAKIDNSQFDNSEVIGFDSLLRQSLDVLHEHFEQKSITVKTQISPDIKINGNSSLTEILINNLLINAIRHTLPNNSVLVTLTNSTFEVANFGEKELNTESLFKRFSRASEDNSGSGLGLAIIKEISSFHHWTISYKFENDHHIFSVYL
ncbi:signal transduction histidine kinase [Chryseobacterium defluvii]|uniref:histidine kinase n=1 Tax=Chryseobacterium defluvii TaxID=160396 RepID=A0A840KCY7_9FLAO|nr:HAMP domain-containing sensor histidine kinase [Chryseobacterium defluvii]MBB4805403.1 signal transduction histidine kinase [Chryseobacterium defluvii]